MSALGYEQQKKQKHFKPEHRKGTTAALMLYDIGAGMQFVLVPGVRLSYRFNHPS